MADRYPCLPDPTPGVSTGSVGSRLPREPRRSAPAAASARRPRSCPTVMDVSFLQPVLAASGPFATVCADVTHTTENADTELDLRVRAIAERLTEQGAPESVGEAVPRRLLEANDGVDLSTPEGRRQLFRPERNLALD